MDKKTIFEELNSILLKIKPSLVSEELNAETRLTEDLHIDSLTVLLLSLAIENRFGIKFDSTPEFTTVADVVSHIESKLV